MPRARLTATRSAPPRKTRDGTKKATGPRVISGALRRVGAGEECHGDAMKGIAHAKAVNTQDISEGARQQAGSPSAQKATGE